MHSQLRTYFGKETIENPNHVVHMIVILLRNDPKRFLRGLIWDKKPAQVRSHKKSALFDDVEFRNHLGDSCIALAMTPFKVVGELISMGKHRDRVHIDSLVERRGARRARADWFVSRSGGLW